MVMRKKSYFFFKVRCIMGTGKLCMGTGKLYHGDGEIDTFFGLLMMLKPTEVLALRR